MFRPDAFMPHFFQPVERVLRIIAALALGLLGLFPTPLAARVISYAPVTGATAYPANQKRTNRHYLLVESDFSASTSGYVTGPSGRVRLYDSTGQTDPRQVFPPGGGVETIGNLAVWEGPDEIPAILVYSSANLAGENPTHIGVFHYSPDAGATWRAVPLPKGAYVSPQFYLNWWSWWGASASSLVSPVDSGGPMARSQRSQIQVGTSGVPFLVAAMDPAKQDVFVVYGIGRDGTLRTIATLQTGSGRSGIWLGSSLGHDRFVLERSTRTSSGGQQAELLQVDLAGIVTTIGTFPYDRSVLDAWIAPSGDVYLNFAFQAFGTSPARHALAIARSGQLTEILSAPVIQSSPIPSVFGVPTADFTGAWIVRRQPGEPTSLFRHTPGDAPVEQWHDDTAPEVEAIHAGASGQRLLVEVNRPRSQPDQRIFRDPALAIWEVDQPAPRSYDELFLREETNRSFVHLDVDAAAQGAPFVFDSGSPSPVYMGGGPSGGAGGGGDVTQEWGVVRASLRQTLVVPAVARSHGMNGSFWKTDLVIRNPSSEPVSVFYYLAQNGAPGPGAGPGPPLVTINLLPNEIRVVPDLVKSLFGFESASGALFLSPLGSASVEATTRTYTTSSEGSVGMGVGAVDLYTAVGPGFPVTFSAALQGNGFHTNVVATDTSGRSAAVQLTVASPDSAPSAIRSFSTPAGGPLQVNGLASWLDVPWSLTSGLRLETTSGSAIPFVVVVDDRTNDPTYFPPDLSISSVRTIPAIVHADGVGGAVYRSDLFLFNPASAARTVTLGAKLWNESGHGTEAVVTLSLLAGESRRIVDPLPTIFGKTGVARLRVQSSGTSSLDGVHVTSRTYSIDSSGGTRGLLIPPLNSFQSAGPGDTLEILGPVGSPAFRTNLSLVELSFPPDTPSNVNVQIEILNEKGAQIDAFTAMVPVAGGLQLNDLFRSRGLGDGPTAALIRVSPAGGMVGAYATTIDNGTTDSTYFAANLGAK